MEHGGVETQRGARTLAVLYPGAIEFEIMLAAQLLGGTWPVDVATPDGDDHVGESGLRFRADGSFASIDPAPYRCLLVPGGDPGSVVQDDTLTGLIRAMHDRSSILAAICAGPVLLGRSGVLRGHRFTHGYTPAQHATLAENWTDATYVDQPVVVDRTIVTAAPEAYIDFAIEVALLAGAIDTRGNATRLARYYRGTPWDATETSSPDS